MKRRAWRSGVEAAAMILALTGAGFFFAGEKATGAALGTAALTVLALGTWAGARQSEADASALRQERDALAHQLSRLEPLAALGMASAGLAHELKNALMVTQGYARLAHRTCLDTEGPPALLAQLRTVETQADSLVDSLQAFMRLAAEEPEEETKPLGTVLDELVALTSPLARQRGLEWQASLDDESMRGLEVSDPSLRSALLDLLLNALEHARSRVRLSLEAPGRIVVSDDGPGVSPAMRERIFEPFVTTRKEGHGLGLHRARAKVEKAGGVLGYEEGAQGGAMFIVRLIPHEERQNLAGA